MIKQKLEKGNIRFFKVDHCGFYKQKSGGKQHVDGDMKFVIEKFNNWVTGREFQNTIPWDVDANPNREQLYCRCIDVDDETGDALVVFWRRIGNGSTKFGGISLKAKVGDDGSQDLNIDTADMIVGQPMYYWFIPEFNVIATVNFPHGAASTENLRHYIKRCFDNRIEHPHKKTSHVDHPVTGNTINVTYKNPDDGSSSRFYFESSLKELSASEMEPDKLATKISHVVTRDVISHVSDASEGKKTIFKLFEKVKEVKDSKKVEITEEVSLNENELRRLIKIHQEELQLLEDDNNWCNIGFKEYGSDKVRWIDSYVTQSYILMSPRLKGSLYFNSKAVMYEIKKKRSSLLSFLALTANSAADNQRNTVIEMPLNDDTIDMSLSNEVSSQG
ncbi:hypothetical protein [Marinomonas sp. ef1]|uniref:hypothetical protein n=1 Tax=Marinomonas sp. ef1 TaxID=2005043 RepID=UPI000C28E0DC|nr:hypothetical protein [Marinomonas sp. ef1]